MAVDRLLDGLADQHLAFIEFSLARLEQEQVRDALLRRLGSATDVTLSKIIELLGFFGDHTVVPAITAYIDHPDKDASDITSHLC